VHSLHTHLQLTFEARQALQGLMGSTAPRTDDTDAMLEAEVAASLWRPHLMLLRGRWEAKLLSMADETPNAEEMRRRTPLELRPRQPHNTSRGQPRYYACLGGVKRGGTRVVS